MPAQSCKVIASCHRKSLPALQGTTLVIGLKGTTGIGSSKELQNMSYYTHFVVDVIGCDSKTC